jgi:hypothetical protein
LFARVHQPESTAFAAQNPREGYDSNEYQTCSN